MESSQEEPNPITISPIGVPNEDDVQPVGDDAQPPYIVDEEAVLAAMYRLERRESRALKRLQQKVKRAQRRRVNESRRRNRK